MFCDKCGKQLPDGALFCDGCGAKLAPAPAPAAEPAPVQAAPTVAPTAAPAAQAPAEKKPLNSKGLIGLAAVAAAVIVVVLAIVLIARSGGGKAPLLYFTGEDLVCSAGKAGDGKTALKGLINSDLRYEAGDAGSAALQMTYNMSLTHDGKTLVYLADYDSSDGTYSLFTVPVKALKKGSAEGTKLASGVNRFTMAEKADVLFYEKSDKLYRYDFKGDPEVVAKDLGGYYYASYAVSPDGGAAAYLKEGDDWYDLYVYSAKSGESEKLDSDVALIYDYDAENGFQAIVYSKYADDGYNEDVYVAGVGAEKEKLVSGAYSVLDAAHDGYVFYATGDDESALYRLDVKSGEKEKLSEDYDYSFYNDASSGVIGYMTYDYDTYDSVCYVSVPGGTKEFDEYVPSCTLSADGKTLYTIECGEGDSEGTLCSYSVGKDGLGERRKIAEDVYGQVLYRANGYIIYATDFSDRDYSATVYALKGKTPVKLGDDVQCYSDTPYGDDGLLFFADCGDSDGTLYTFDGKKATKVASDVLCYNYVELGGKLYFLADYDEDNGGTLCRWNGKSKEKLANDVLAIVPLS